MAAEPAFGADVARVYDDSRALPAAALAELQRRLSAIAGLKPGARVLDVGAGTGLLAETLQQMGCSYVGVDASISMLRQFAVRRRGGAALLQADLRSLPFAAGLFDAVLAFRVFGVVRGWRRGIAECLRVAKPGGGLVLGHVERPSGSLHMLLREWRNAWLVAHGFEAERLGAGDSAVFHELASAAEPEEAVAPVLWVERVTPRGQLDANLSGWRVQALDAALRAELRADLLAVLSERFSDVDRLLDEPVALVLRVFRTSH